MVLLCGQLYQGKCSELFEKVQIKATGKLKASYIENLFGKPYNHEAINFINLFYSTKPPLRCEYTKLSPFNEKLHRICFKKNKSYHMGLPK